MINYYRRHLPDLVNVLEPLHNLPRKSIKWRWGRKERNNFEKVKEPLFSPKLLVPFLLIIACDTSLYGIGAALSHKYPDNSERLIAYMSKSLSSAEKNYLKIEKEGLAIVYA